MEYDIRPLSFGEILDRSLRILVDNAPLLIGISAVFAVPENALTVPGRWLQLTFSLLALTVVPLVHAALTCAVADVYLDRPVTIASAYKSGWSIVFPFLGTYMIMYSVFVLGGGGLAVIAIGGTVAQSRALGLIFILAVIAAIPSIFYVTTRWSLIGPVMIVERRFGLSALRRSRDLVAGVWWRTFGIILVAALIARVPLAALDILWSSIPVVGIVLGGLTTAIGFAYGAVAILVYYFDRRCRIEDFDLRLLAEQVRSESAHGSPAVAGAPSLGQNL